METDRKDNTRGIRKYLWPAGIGLFILLMMFSKGFRDAVFEGVNDGLQTTRDNWNESFGTGRERRQGPSRERIDDTLNLHNDLADVQNAVWATSLNSDVTFDRAKRKLEGFESVLGDRSEFKNADPKLTRCCSSFVHLAYRRLGLVEMARELTNRARDVQNTAMSWNASKIEDFVAEAAVKLASGAFISSTFKDDIARITNTSEKLSTDYDEWNGEFQAVRKQIAKDYNLSFPDLE